MRDEAFQLYWDTAKGWLDLWASAGFRPRIEGDKAFMPAGWIDKFEDGPDVVNLLRPFLLAQARGERSPVDAALYVAHLEKKIEHENTVIAHCRRIGFKAEAARKKLLLELAEVRNSLPRKP